MVPETLAVVLEKDPVISGISCVTFTSASSLFMVINEGVEMMLLLPSLRSACISAAKLTPLFTTRPIATVAPVPTVELLMVGCADDARDGSWRPVRALGEAQGGGGQIDDAGAGAGQIDDAGRHGAAALAEQQPLHAEVGALVDVDFDDDGFDLDLRAADIELVDHAHQRLHDLGRRRDDQRIGGDIRPDGDAGIDIGRAAARGGRSLTGRRAALRLGRGGGLSLELVGDLFGVGIAQIAHLDIAAGGHGRVHVEDQRLEPQARRALAGQQDAVGALIGNDFDDGAAPRRPRPN